MYSNLILTFYFVYVSLCQEYTTISFSQKFLLQNFESNKFFKGILSYKDVNFNIGMTNIKEYYISDFPIKTTSSQTKSIDNNNITVFSINEKWCNDNSRICIKGSLLLGIVNDSLMNSPFINIEIKDCVNQIFFAFMPVNNSQGSISISSIFNNSKHF